MVKALFALAKYLTWWFFKPLVYRCCAVLCCKSHTHAANIKFQRNACSSCFKQYFPSLLGRENIHNYFIKSMASSHYFIKSIARSRCVEDTPRNTHVHTLVYVKYSPVRWVFRKLRPKSIKQFRVIPRIASSRLVYCSSIHCPNLNVSGSATWLPNCIAKLSRNRHCANRTARLESLLNHLQW